DDRASEFEGKGARLLARARASRKGRKNRAGGPRYLLSSGKDPDGTGQISASRGGAAPRGGAGAGRREFSLSARARIPETGPAGFGARAIRSGKSLDIRPPWKIIEGKGGIHAEEIASLGAFPAGRTAARKLRLSSSGLSNRR